MKIVTENKKIYLSRRHTVPKIYGAVNPRKLVNVEEVSKKIVSLGYEEVFTEKLTFGEKIDLFKIEIEEKIKNENRKGVGRSVGRLIGLIRVIYIILYEIQLKSIK